MKHPLMRALLYCAIAVVLCAAALGQVNTASLTGLVTDASGGALPM